MTKTFNPCDWCSFFTEHQEYNSCDAPEGYKCPKPEDIDLESSDTQDEKCVYPSCNEKGTFRNRGSFGILVCDKHKNKY